MIDGRFKAIGNGKLVGFLMVTFRKAYGVVEHNNVLQKLKLYKCDENSSSLVHSHLSNRTQITIMNHKCSGREPIKSGVPQCPILGPFMFLMFINDLPVVFENGELSTDLYADDTTSYDIQSNMRTLERNIQKLLLLINK